MGNRESFPVFPMKITALVNFYNPNASEDTTANVTVSGLSWINEESIIILTFAGVTADHQDPDDAQVEGLTACVGNLAPGVGFDILAVAPNGTWGHYQITAIIVA